MNFARGEKACFTGVSFEIGDMLEIVGVVFSVSYGVVLQGPVEDGDFKVVAFVGKESLDGTVKNFRMGRVGRADFYFRSVSVYSPCSQNFFHYP